MTKRWWGSVRLGLVTAVMLLLAACSGGGEAPADVATDGAAGGSLEEACAAGQEEGRLVYWHNLAQPEVIIEAFNETYPDIQVEHLQLRPDDAAQRLLAETASGRAPATDIIYGGQEIFTSVIEAGLIDDTVDWEALGVDPEIVTDSNMVRLFVDAAGLSYNTDELSADDLPDTWEDLLDPKWAGQVVVDPRGRPWDQLSLVWGEQETLDYVTEFTEVVQPVVIEGGTAGLVAVAGGEALLSTGGRNSETQEHQANGAPIDIKYLNIVPTLDAYHAVVADAAHPNAARCWVAWMATEGREIHQESELKTNDTIPPAAPDDAEIVSIDTPDKADTVADMSQRVGELLQ
jgi:iron(III) transport system substrate-binding protein